MLKGQSRANLRYCSESDKKYISSFLIIYDSLENTSLFSIFQSIYDSNEILTLEELSHNLNYGLTTLHRYIHKLNQIIEIIACDDDDYLYS